MLVQFGNNWIQKIPLTAKSDSACGLVQFCLSSKFFLSNYFQIGQHVVLLHIQIETKEITSAKKVWIPSILILTILPCRFLLSFCFHQEDRSKSRDNFYTPSKHLGSISPLSRLRSTFLPKKFGGGARAPFQNSGS